MKTLRRLLAAAVLSSFVSSATAAETHVFAITLSLAPPSAFWAQVSSPLLRITVTNLSSKLLRVPEAGAFFDYSITVLDHGGLPVPLTKEGDAIRTGKGNIVISRAIVIQLQPGESHSEDLDLRRYYELKTPGKYTVQVTRELGTPPDKVSSNILEMNLKESPKS